MTEVLYRPPALLVNTRRKDGACEDCRENLAGPFTTCGACRLDMHLECAMYQMPDGVVPYCEACFYKQGTEKYLTEAKGNGEYFKERAPRKKRRNQPWW